MPMLFLSGDDDELVPQVQMHTLYDRCPSKRKEFHSFKNAMHSMSLRSPRRYLSPAQVL